jgi:hypothetical protein
VRVARDLTLLARIVLFAVWFVLLPRVSRAENRRLAVYVEGNDSVAVRTALVRLAPAGVTIDKGDFGRALKKGGRLPLGKAFDDPQALGERARRAMESARDDLAILASVKGTRTGRIVHVFLFTRAGGDPEVDQTVTLGRRRSPADSKNLSNAVSPALSRLASSGAAPASPSEPSGTPAAGGQPSASAETPAGSEDASGAETPSAGASSSSASSGASAGASAEAPEPEPTGPPKPYEVTQAKVVVELAGGAAARKFDYTDRLSRNLRPYSVYGIPMVGANAEIYPFPAKRGPMHHVGVVGTYAQAIPFDSAPPTGTGQLKTYYMVFDLGARYRVALGEHSVFGARLTFGAEDFTFHAAGDLATQIPSVRYRYMRPGVDIRFPLGGMSLLLGVGYRLIFDGGRVVDRFPHASLQGVDGTIGVALPLGTKLELRITGRYDRYFYAMHPVPGDTYVAGGALDQFIGAQAGLAYGF